MFTILNMALVNLLLSTDNVLVIALFAREFGQKKRLLVLLWGMLASLVLQLIILFIIALLFRVTFLQAVFGLIICYMALHLFRKGESTKVQDISSQKFLTIIGKIVLSNLMMSFENEATLITMARGEVWLAWSGFLLTAPLIFFGSNLIVWLLHKFNFVLYLGSVLLFKIGLNLIFEMSGINRFLPYGPWVLTGLFAVYVISKYLQKYDIQLTIFKQNQQSIESDLWDKISIFLNRQRPKV